MTRSASPSNPKTFSILENWSFQMTSHTPKAAKRNPQEVIGSGDELDHDGHSCDLSRQGEYGDEARGQQIDQRYSGTQTLSNQVEDGSM